MAGCWRHALDSSHFSPDISVATLLSSQKVAQATNTPPLVDVQLLQGGSPLPSGTNLISGNIFVAASVTLSDTNQQLSSVGIFVDGQRLYSVPSYSSTNYVNSTEWPNGPHEIYAIATTVDSGETIPGDDSQTETNAANLAIGVSVSRFCVFSNYISQFFVAVPYFEAGQTQEVVAKFEEDSYWRVKVVNYLDTEVRRVEGQDSSAYAAWDGNDPSGSPLPYGFYDYIVEARPSRFGPLDSMSAMASTSGGETDSASYSADPDPTSGYRRTPAAMQFSRRNSNVTENLIIPSLNPAPPLSDSPASAQSASAISERVVTYSVSEDGTTNEFINGVPAFLYPPDQIIEDFSVMPDDGGVAY